MTVVIELNVNNTCLPNWTLSCIRYIDAQRFRLPDRFIPSPIIADRADQIRSKSQPCGMGGQVKRSAPQKPVLRILIPKNLTDRKKYWTHLTIFAQL